VKSRVINIFSAYPTDTELLALTYPVCREFR
jgi:hypothetical protein